jgi:hypothetical protein
LGVALLALLKALLPRLLDIPWPEVFYGPALTVAAVFLIVMLASWLETSIRRRI